MKSGSLDEVKRMLALDRMKVDKPKKEFKTPPKKDKDKDSRYDSN